MSDSRETLPNAPTELWEKACEFYYRNSDAYPADDDADSTLSHIEVIGEMEAFAKSLLTNASPTPVAPEAVSELMKAASLALTYMRDHGFDKIDAKFPDDPNPELGVYQTLKTALDQDTGLLFIDSHLQTGGEPVTCPFCKEIFGVSK